MMSKDILAFLRTKEKKLPYEVKQNNACKAFKLLPGTC